MSPDSINVIKRNGRGTEPLNLEKIHEMVAHACKDLTGVSESQVEMSSAYNSSIKFQQTKYNKY